jgi:hypothetical protein
VLDARRGGPLPVRPGDLAGQRLNRHRRHLD